MLLLLLLPTVRVVVVDVSIVVVVARRFVDVVVLFGGVFRCVGDVVVAVV